MTSYFVIICQNSYLTPEQVEGEAHSTITNVSVSGTSSITEQAYQVMPTKAKSRRSAADSQPIFPQPMMLHTSDGQSMQVLVPNGGDHHPAMFPQAIVIKHEEPDPDAVSQVGHMICHMTCRMLCQGMSHVLPWDISHNMSHDMSHAVSYDN